MIETTVSAVYRSCRVSFSPSLRFTCRTQRIDTSHWITIPMTAATFGADKALCLPHFCQILLTFSLGPEFFHERPKRIPFFFAMTRSLISPFYGPTISSDMRPLIRAFPQRIQRDNHIVLYCSWVLVITRCSPYILIHFTTIFPPPSTMTLSMQSIISLSGISFLLADRILRNLMYCVS